MKALLRDSLSVARRDALVVTALTLLAAALCTRFDASELLLTWTRPHERYQLDELPVVMLVLALGLVWFAARRWRDARQAQSRLAATLADNRRLTALYLEALEAERRAMARDLHDELGQYLSALELDLISMRDRHAAQDALFKAGVGAMLTNVQRMHGAVIGLIRQLRPAGLDELGLAAALEHCVDEWRRRLPHTSIELTVDDALDRLDEPRRVAFYRLIQEAMTNIARHSHAKHVAIRIEQTPASAYQAASLLVQVNDDGVGADPAQHGRGLGLLGMRERTQALGGEVSVRTAPQSGFAIEARIPLAVAR